ncbi:MAG TPA: hypothetical protein VJU82_06180, partial [Acidobacteriaceae bacterium]|nr:hypothetical protein [Acidobacteriaceae bacterium]
MHTGFERLAELAETLAHESSRLKKRAAIAEAIEAVHAESGGAEAGLFAQYLAGMPFAEADPRKLNAGGALLSKVVLAVAGASDAELGAAYRRHGDLGAAAFDLLEGRKQGKENKQQQAPLTLPELGESFAAMAAARTTAARASLVDSLLRRATPLEAKYLLKLMLGDMRIGVKQSLVEEAIAAAASKSRSQSQDLGHPVSVEAVRHAVMLEADLAHATERAFAGTLGETRMRLFHPLGFMLASPVDSPEEAVQRFKKSESAVQGGEPTGHIAAFLEDKYDGMRAQVHCGDLAQPGRVAIYSRNREDITESYPELAEAFAQVPCRPEMQLIFDGEILGWNFAAGEEDERGRALPFAVLGERIGRKRVTNEVRARVPVVFMAFDLMCEGGELILERPLRERRNRLEAILERVGAHTVSPLRI